MMRKTALLLVVIWVAALPGVCHGGDARPNFLFIVCEDTSPDLGCYGDANARTPNLDKFASQGARFTRAFTHAPVCAPSRSGLITGMYPTAIGSHHMRSKLIKPPPTFTSLLRKAGYFVAWPGKTDFNFDVPPDAFDSTKNWTDRAPGKPFFAYVNFTQSHESQIRNPPGQRSKAASMLKPDEFHDPAKMVVPPFYPDTPEVRRDLANYYDLVTAVDYKVGEVLAELEKRGEVENTVVFFFGDHGRGMSRCKRWVYNTGIQVPLLIRWPGQIQPGAVREDLVCFLDFAPTVLHLAGAPVPPEMHGQVILGPDAKERRYVFSARDRMDETYDRIRSVREKDFHYIRNFEPQLPYAQRIAYMDLMPTMQVWRKLNAEGKLEGPPKLFFAPRKPDEELYDVSQDPYEVNNLAADQKHQGKLQGLRAALDQWIADTKDLGAIPEKELVEKGLVKDVLTKYEERKKPGFKLDEKK